MHHFFTRPLAARVRDEQGIALIIALMVMILMTALGTALVLTTMTEGKIAANYRDSTEALYAADAGVERVLQDILTVADWNGMIDPANKLAKSAFVNGDEEWRELPDGTRLNLRQATNMLNCLSVENCTVGQMNAVTDDRPWGRNNPQWKLYAHGPLTDLLPTEAINSPFYVAVWVADDPSESDNDPLKDGEPTLDCTPTLAAPEVCVNLGRGVIAMLAKAYGPGGVERTIEVTLARTDTTEIERNGVGPAGVRILSWREVR